MRSHEVDYTIIGDDMQIVEVELDPGETVIAEAGAMSYMDDGISFEAKMGDGSKPDSGLFGKLFDAGKRVITGESLFMTHFTNTAHGKKSIAFGAPYPGKIIPLNLANTATSFSVRRTRFCAPPSELSWISGLPSGWGPVFSEERVLSFRNSAATEWPLSMPGARWLRRN